MIIDRIEGFVGYMLLALVAVVVHTTLTVALGVFLFANAFVSLVSPKVADELYLYSDRFARRCI